MTLEYIPNKTRQAGDNITVSFNFLFKVFAGKEATDLLVYKIDRSTIPESKGSALTYGIDYTVVLSTTAEGGTVTYTVAPTSTEDAFIIREVDYKQETELKPNNKFNEVTIENSFDKDAMVNTQLLEQTERTIKVSEIYTGSTDLTLPPPEASKVIGYDATGLSMTNYSGSDLDTILTTSYGQQLVQSADAETARDFLELGTIDDVEFAEITGSNYVGLPDATTTIKGVAEISTKAEVETGTDDTKIISPKALRDAMANSQVANGYTKLSNGIIIQWGKYTGGAHAPTVTFPITFPNAVTSIVANAQGTTAGVMCIYNTLTAADVIIKQYRYDNATSILDFNWMAIGY